jgi:hypothetical protein
MLHYVFLLLQSWGLNLDLHACLASALLLKPCPQPCNCVFKKHCPTVVPKRLGQLILSPRLSESLFAC